MRVCVYGLWHLGIVTTAGLIKKWHTVVGLDWFDFDKISKLNKGEPPIFELGVSELLVDGINTSRLAFTNQPTALEDAEVVWVTYDTPINKNDAIDIDYIENMVMRIAPFLQDQTKLIISSQVPVGFTKKLERSLVLKYPGKKIYIAYSPENLRLGNALDRFLNPERIIVGCHPEEKKEFEPFFNTLSQNIFWMNIPSAEMTKHAINSYLAMSICFANEIARICEQVGANTTEVELGLRSDRRIGYSSYTKSGDAFSGGTLARDVITLKDVIRRTNTDAHVISAITESNESHKSWIRMKCLETMNYNISGSSVLVFGLTYKEGTNTLRRSGALDLCEWLHEQGANVYAYDPILKPGEDNIPSYIHIIDKDLDHILNNCYAVIILKDLHVIFEATKTECIREKVVIDPNGYLLNMFKDTSDMRYFSVRRP
jgi:UDPglucose 6-dehydrogenase